MSTRDLLLDRISSLADLLGDEIENLVFVGGAAIAACPIWAGADVRPTEDLDCIVEASRTTYAELQARLQALGFRDAPEEGDPLCRFRRGELVIDVMPIDREVLGFSNRWFEHAFRTAVARVLPTETTVRIATPLALTATKMEAFLSRGNGNYLASHDLEDVFALLAGDPGLIDDIADGLEEVHEFLRSHLRRICTDPISGAEIRGHFAPDAASQQRGTEVIRRLRALPGA